MAEQAYTLDQIKHAFFEVFIGGTGDYGFYAEEFWDEFIEERWGSFVELLENEEHNGC